MKSLIMVRHAKSSWDVAGQNDIDRTLNARGKKDAPEMARRLLEQHILIDAFISSPAARAKETAAFYMEAYNAGQHQLKINPALYPAAAEAFISVIEDCPDTYGTVAIFSHNPGITAFVNSLTPVRIEDMPTCSMFAVHCHIDNWKDFGLAEKEFWFFDYPKSVK